MFDFCQYNANQIPGNLQTVSGLSLSSIQRQLFPPHMQYILMTLTANIFQAYPSNKALANWTRDLVHRVDQFAKWASTAHQPVIFWLSGFTFPTGFLTAVLQTSARQNNISVDTLSWEFTVSTVDDSNITQYPKVRQMYNYLIYNKVVPWH